MKPSSVSTPAQDATALADRLASMPASEAIRGPKDWATIQAALRAATQTPDAVREALTAIDDLIKCFGIGDHPSVTWQRTRCDDGIDMVHHAGDTIFFGDANHEDESDARRFDLIVRVINLLPSVRATLSSASAQTPDAVRECPYCQATSDQFDPVSSSPDFVRCRNCDCEFLLRSTPSASAGPQAEADGRGAVIELAAWLCALEDAECHKPVPESLIEHGRRYIHAGMTEKHCGDCTNESHSCVVCGTDGYLLHARQIRAALSATDGPAK